MDKSRLETKVGIFVFIGMAMLAILLIQFSKGTSLFRSAYELHLHASNVGGIKPRAEVLLAGVQVGTVTDIKIDPSGTNVTLILKIYKEFPVYHDANFVIEQAGFLGDQFVSINPTENQLPLLTNGEDVVCEPPFNLQEVARGAAGFIQRIDSTAQKLDASVSDLRRQVLNTQTLSSFAVAVTNMRAFSEEALGAVRDIHTLVTTNSAQVGSAVSNLDYFTVQLDQLAGSAQGVLASNSVNIDAATKNIADISGTLKQMSDDLHAGRGLAGAFLEDQQLATNVQVLAANLALTSSNLNRHGIWGIMWSHKPSTVATNTTSSPSKPSK